MDMDVVLALFYLVFLISCVHLFQSESGDVSCKGAIQGSVSILTGRSEE